MWCNCFPTPSSRRQSGSLRVTYSSRKGSMVIASVCSAPCCIAIVVHKIGSPRSLLQSCHLETLAGSRARSKAKKYTNNEHEASKCIRFWKCYENNTVILLWTISYSNAIQCWEKGRCSLAFGEVAWGFLQPHVFQNPCNIPLSNLTRWMRSHGFNILHALLCPKCVTKTKNKNLIYKIL